MLDLRVFSPVDSVQVAPFSHGLLAHSSTSMSQLPVNAASAVATVSCAGRNKCGNECGYGTQCSHPAQGLTIAIFTVGTLAYVIGAKGNRMGTG